MPKSVDEDWLCKMCNFKVDSRSSACSKCNNTFQNQQTLNKQESIKERDLMCSICGSEKNLVSQNSCNYCKSDLSVKSKCTVCKVNDRYKQYELCVQCRKSYAHKNSKSLTFSEFKLRKANLNFVPDNQEKF